MVALSSFTCPTSGIMILAFGWPPDALTAMSAFRIARVWTFTKSGIIRPSRQPRSPSIGFCSCMLLIVASSSLSSSDAPPLISARVTLTSWSSRFGRNSWSGGSISRMTTGRPSMARKMPSKSPCWRTSSLPIAASKTATECASSSLSVAPAAALALARVAAFATRIAPRTISSRSPSRNMCSVRHRPMPCAP